MKAMILAAGLGTRLRPLTDKRPKALVEVAGRTLLEITLTRLRSFGVSEVVINVHHFAQMVVDYLNSHNNFSMRIEVSREDDLLLDTGGGLKKAAWFFLEDSCRTSSSQATENETRRPIASLPAQADATRASTRPRGFRVTNPGQPNRGPMTDRLSNLGEPFLLHNVDVISNIDFRRMLQFHNQHRALATLAVQSRPSSRLLLFNDELQLVGRATPGAAATKEVVISGQTKDPGNLSTEPTSTPTRAALRSPLRGEPPLSLAFSGIHVISPRLLPMLTEEGVFSIIDVYLRLAALGEEILAFRSDEYFWRDVGRPSDLAQAALDFKRQEL